MSSPVIKPKTHHILSKIAYTGPIYVNIRTKTSVTFTPICVVTTIYRRMTFLGLDSVLNGRKVALSCFEISVEIIVLINTSLDIGFHLLKPLDGTDLAELTKLLHQRWK